MGRIIDFVKGNFFWVAAVLAVAGIGAAYFLGVRQLAGEVEGLRVTSSGNINKLRELAWLSTIPSQRMIDAAIQEENDFHAAYGQLMTIYSLRSEFLGERFPALRNVQNDDGFKVTERLQWWKDYREQIEALQKIIRADFTEAPEDLLVFDETANPPAGIARALELENRFRVLKTVVDTIARASPKEDPLIYRLASIRISRQPASGLKHPWLSTVFISIRAGMYYHNIPKLIAGLQNSPRPLAVTSYEVAWPTKPGDKSGEVDVAAEGPIPVLDVTLSCEFPQFLPVLNFVAFRGPLFKNQASVKTWLQKEDRSLNFAFRSLLELVPALKNRVSVELGAKLHELERKADEARDRELRTAEEDIAAELEKELNEASQKGGAIDPGQEEKIRRGRSDALVLKQQEIRQKREEDRLAVLGKAGGFALAYNYLYPLARDRAYFIGGNLSDRGVLIVRDPDANGKWWLAVAEGGRTFSKTVASGKPRTKAQVIRDLLSRETGTAKLTPVDVSPGTSDAPTIFMFGSGPRREAVYVLIEDADGGWQTYPVLKVQGRALSLSDTAFRFASVINAAARRINLIKPAPDALRIEITPASAMQKANTKSIKIDATDGLTGTIEVTVGLRN